MLLDLLGEIGEGMLKGFAKTSLMSSKTGRKFLKNRKQQNQSSFWDDVKYNKDYYTDRNVIPLLDDAVGGAIGLGATLLNRGGQALGATMAVGGALAASPFIAAWQGLKYGRKAFKAADDALINATGGYGMPTPWRTVRTLAGELPHEVWGNAKLLGSLGKIGYKGVKATNSPTLGLATVGLGVGAGIAASDWENGSTHLAGLTGISGLSIFGETAKSKDNFGGNTYVDPETGQLQSALDPSDGNYWQASTGVGLSPNNPRHALNRNGADGNLALASHYAR